MVLSLALALAEPCCLPSHISLCTAGAEVASLQAPVSADHKHWHAPAVRGSTSSPGPAALQLAAQWLQLLTLVLAQQQLPSSGLTLVSDLVQLLFYHTAWPAPSESPGAKQPDVMVRASMLCPSAAAEAKRFMDWCWRVPHAPD